jgi:hypothetical protein
VAGPRTTFSNGGGLFVTGGGADTFHKVIASASQFDNNRADVGGGIFYRGDGRVDLDITQNSSITGNIARAGNGGGLYAYARAGSSIEVRDSTVSLNATAENNGDGGGLAVRLAEVSSLLIEDSIIANNMAGRRGDGGGIHTFVARFNSNPLPVRIASSVISGNTAGDRGAGLYSHSYRGTEVRVEDTQVTDNHMPADSFGKGNGGGIYAYVTGNSSGVNTPKFTITGSTIDNNDATNKACGVFVCGKFFGDFVAINSTVSGNRTLNDSTGAGGGLFIARFGSPYALNESIDAFLANVTVTQNVGALGGGVVAADLINVRVRIANSIISQNFSDTNQTIPNNLVGRLDIDNTKFNLVGSGSTILDLAGASASLDSTNITDNDTPLLGPLQNNGGPTPTHALLQGRAAIDAGSDALAKNGLTNQLLTTDQRGIGFPRSFDLENVIVPGAGPVDIGAYEIGLPKVIDVLIDGVTWNNTSQEWTRAPYSFADLVPLGKQLAPIFTDGVNKIQVRFSEDIRRANGTLPNGSELTLHGTGTQPLTSTSTIAQIPGTFIYNSEARLASWTFPVLGFDRYRIDIEASQVRNIGGNALDGHWDNLMAGTPYDWGDDPLGRALVSGNNMSGCSFQFMFALLAADYDQNGQTDGDDFLLWQRSLGVDPSIDGNGDGIISSQDLYLWLARVGTYLEILPDFNMDGAVNELDLTIWWMNVGIWSGATFSQGDADFDGDTDGDDFLTWQRLVGKYSAWIESACGLATAMAVVDSTTAPRVTNVTISGSDSTHNPFSFDSHDGSGEQLRTVPVGAADTISITFSEAVNVEESYLGVVGLRTANVPTVVEFAYDAVSMTATWRFDDLIASDHYLISLSDAVTDAEGYRLDGEWVNPTTLFTTNTAVSEFPSGDGHAGGSFNFVMTLLAGDANLNNKVNGQDYGIWELYWAQDGSYIEGDFNGNGIVEGSD